MRIGLGDAVSKALAAVGITEDRVAAWIGKPCRCRERREKLNRLGAWALRILSGRTEDAQKHLDDMVGEDKDASKGEKK